MAAIPSPEPRGLIPPILACLPTAFISPRPPPALLPLLSPILRQRVHLLTPTLASHPGNESNWLKLLTYSPARGAHLIEIVEDMQLEPHPVSGELELFNDGEEPEIKYRRRDSETLHARCEAKQYRLIFMWIWCVGDQGGTGLEALEGALHGSYNQEANQLEPQDGWKLAEILPLEDMEDDDVRLQWYLSIREANEAEARNNVISSLAPRSGGGSGTNGGTGAVLTENQAMSDDEDYWASYDMTPGRTPRKTSPRPIQNGDLQELSPVNGQAQHLQQNTVSTGESDYYGRYDTEVQPAMDAHDPDEDVYGIESTTGADQVPPRRSLYDQNLYEEQQEDDYTRHQAAVAATEYASFMPSSNVEPAIDFDQQCNHNPATTPAVEPDSGESEQAARNFPMERNVTLHISTEIKSLFRLARSAGIARQEFERVVRTELDLLSMLDE